MVERNIQVLLVEDSPGDVRLIQELLSVVKMASFQIQVAERLSDALETLSARRFDVVLLDLNLPDSSGLDTLTKAQSKAQQVSIIVLTGLDDEELALEAVRKGAQDYLVKGQIYENLLSRAIRYAIERKRAEEALRQSEELYRSVVEGSIEGICIYQDDIIQFANQAYAKIFGYTSPDELVDKNVWETLVAPEGWDRQQKRTSNVLDGKASPVSHIWQGIRKDGTRIWIISS